MRLAGKGSSSWGSSIDGTAGCFLVGRHLSLGDKEKRKKLKFSSD